VSISYSHVDKKWANWVHKKMESYKVDKKINSKFNSIKPVFKDIEELSATTDLPRKIKLSLEESETLTVICSKNSRKSAWVNMEVEYFIETRGIDDIFLFVIDGEPFSNNENEVIPEALLKYDRDIKNKVLYCDAKSDKNIAFFKLISGILNVNYDKLIEREKIRKRKKVYVLFLAHEAEKKRDLSIINEHIESANKLQIQNKYEDALGDLDKVKKILGKQSGYKWKLSRSSILNDIYPFPALSLRERQSAQGALSITTNKDFSEVASSHEDGSIRIIQLSDFSNKKIKVSDEWIHNVTYLDNNEIISINMSGEIFSIKEDKVNLIFDSKINDPNDIISFGKDDVLFAGNNNIFDFSVKDGKLATLHNHHKSKVISLKLFNSNKYLASGDESGKLIIFDIENKEIIKEFDAGSRILDIAVSPDNTVGMLATSSNLQVFQTSYNPDNKSNKPIFDEYFKNNKLIVYPASDKLKEIKNIEFATDFMLLVGMENGTIADIDIRNVDIEYYSTGNDLNKVLPIFYEKNALIVSADTMGVKFYDYLFSKSFNESSAYLFEDDNKGSSENLAVNSSTSEDEQVSAVYYGNIVDFIDSRHYL
jgi:WD40 repeat protein